MQIFRGNDKNQCHSSWISSPTLRVYIKGQENRNAEISAENLFGESGAMSISFWPSPNSERGVQCKLSVGLICDPALGCGRRVSQWTDILIPFCKSWQIKISWLEALVVEQVRDSALLTSHLASKKWKLTHQRIPKREPKLEFSFYVY